MLAPMVDFALKTDLAPRLLPVTDSGKRVACAIAVWLPEIEHDRLARRPEVEALRDWHLAVGIAVVFAPGEEGGVWFHEIDGPLQIVIQLNLNLYRVGAQVDEPAGRAMLGQRLGATVQVEDQLSRAV